MSEPRGIEYRRMVSNIFRELSADDVQQIAYIRLVGKDDITKYSAAKQRATSLDLMQTLERYGFFSQDNIDGLIEVLRDARRSDLVKRVEVERHQLSRSCPAVKAITKRFRGGKKPNVSAPPRSSTPTEERAGRFQESRQSVEDWVTGRVLPLHPRTQLKEQELIEAKQNNCSKLSTTTASPTASKKKPLLPPTHRERITQETVVNSTTQQQLVFHKQKPVHALKALSKPPSTRPPPPPKKPPIAKRRHFAQEDKTDDQSRDSGNWTGSFSDNLAEWTKHHSKSLPDLSDVSQYQSLGSKEECNEYAIPQ